MKRNIYTVISLLLASGAAFAQAHLDTRAAMLVQSTIEQSTPAARSGEVRAYPAEFGPNDTVTVLVTLSEGYDESVLTNLGLNPGPLRAGSTLVSLTPMQLVGLADAPGIAAIDLGTMSRPLLKEARSVAGVDAIHEGTGLDRAYTGQGVICGMMDIGLDPNHANFLDADGNQRIKRMWVLTGSNGSIQTFSGSNITSYTTDNSKETHGTHVLGIMAGGYRDRLQQAFFNASGKKQISTTRKNNYYGVAPDAEIAPCCGTLDGNNILLAAENILAYSKEVGKPAVLNLSLSHNTGPHDGTTKADKYLADVGREMLITVAAGNEGYEPMSIRKTFTTADNTVRTFVGDQATATAMVDIWSFDDKPFTVTVDAYDTEAKKSLFSYEVSAPTSGTQYITGSYYTAPGYIHPAGFDDCFTNRGAILIKASVDPNNNRYNCSVSFDTKVGTNKNIVPSITVKGSAGQTADIYCSSDGSLLNLGVDGYTQGNSSNSINDMACGENIISVGAFVSSVSWPTLTSEFTYRYHTKGDIASFSSYGTTPDGRQLPFVAAPGSAIISSISTYNYNSSPDSHSISAVLETTPRNSYWEEMSGTSMAAPFMGGVLALWLQADPTLTVDEVKDIIKETAVQDEFTRANPHRFGVGKVDALAGIKKVLNIGAGVNGVKAENEILVSETAKNVFNIYAPSAETVLTNLYTVSGALAASSEAVGNDATLDATSLPAGVYILSVKAGSASRTVKIAIR